MDELGANGPEAKGPWANAPGAKTRGGGGIGAWANDLDAKGLGNEWFVGKRPRSESSVSEHTGSQRSKGKRSVTDGPGRKVCGPMVRVQMVQGRNVW